MKKKLYKGNLIRCPLCDEWYEEYGPRWSDHEHPEPQSGPPRIAWLESKMPYEKWIKLTAEGKAWALERMGIPF